MLAGLGAAFLASICLGTVFVPIKYSPPTDGFVVQFFFCLGGLLVAIIVHGLQGFPQIYPLVMIGGALWCFANSFSFQIMNRLGMLCILIWNTTSCLTGWATSRFGFFGIPQIQPASILLNYIGVALLIVGAVFYAFIRSNPEGRKANIDLEEKIKHEEEKKEISLGERVLFMVFSLVAGIFFGSMCTPVTFIQSHSNSLFPGAPSSGLPYVLPFFLGVFLMTLFIFFIYTVLHQSSQLIDGLLALRSLLGGVFFGLGITFFFIANELLSPTVAYPLISTFPSLIVSLWSVLYFKEITGRRNLIILAIAYSITLAGVAFVAVSKEISL